jgi:hypothetical protein
VGEQPTPESWRDIPGLLPEHVASLEWLEAELTKLGVRPEEAKAQLLAQAHEFKQFQLGDVVHSEVKPPTDAGRLHAWSYEGERWLRRFEGRGLPVHCVEVHVVGSQFKDSESDKVTTRRQIRVSGDTILTTEQAEEVAATILQQVASAREYDSQDNPTD